MLKILISITLFKKLKSFIRQLLNADLRLSPYTDFLVGNKVWMRPMFPNDHLTLEDCFTDPIHIQYFGTGAVWSKMQIKEVFYSSAHKNLILNHTAVWSIISDRGLTGCFWLTKKKNEGQLESKETKEHKECEETAEIGYCSRPALSGRGYTTEAGHLVINSFPTEFNGLIFATVHPKNKGSQKVLEKLGLKPDPEKQNMFIEKYKASRNFYQLPKRV